MLVCSPKTLLVWFRGYVFRIAKELERGGPRQWFVLAEVHDFLVNGMWLKNELLHVCSSTVYQLFHAYKERHADSRRHMKQPYLRSYHEQYASRPGFYAGMCKGELHPLSYKLPPQRHWPNLPILLFSF